ncbi:6734_t:CDS:2 [Entrophospora sp. SA101]|nr:7417_t:CDS:2 [Entrophospora sp. SA101]CAJ0824646.1 6734_t:CDS:2 [Entrophospora sp. SA101]
MPKNIYLPKENIPKVEEIREIKNEYPSYEEFIKIYEPNEEVEILTEVEYQDRLLHGPQYGPGNEQSSSSSRERESKKILMYMGKQVTDMVVNEVISETIGYGPFLGLGMTQLMMSKFAKQKELKELSEKLASDGMSMLRSGAMGTLEAAQESYKTYDDTKPYFEVIKHFSHLNEGKEYESGCKVCEE